MADCISIVASVMAIASATSSLVSTLYDFHRADRVLKGFRHELEGINGLLQTVRRCLDETEPEHLQSETMKNLCNKLSSVYRDADTTFESLTQTLRESSSIRGPWTSQRSDRMQIPLIRLLGATDASVKRQPQNAVSREPVIWRLGSWLRVSVCHKQFLELLTFLSADRNENSIHLTSPNTRILARSICKCPPPRMASPSSVRRNILRVPPRTQISEVLPRGKRVGCSGCWYG
jgi:hypothetical protein